MAGRGRKCRLYNNRQLRSVGSEAKVLDLSSLPEGHVAAVALQVLQHVTWCIRHSSALIESCSQMFQLRSLNRKPRNHQTEKQPQSNAPYLLTWSYHKLDTVQSLCFHRTWHVPAPLCSFQESSQLRQAHALLFRHLRTATRSIAVLGGHSNFITYTRIAGAALGGQL